MHHSKATVVLTMRPFNAWLKGLYDEQAVLVCFVTASKCVISSIVLNCRCRRRSRVHVNTFQILATFRKHRKCGHPT